MRTPIVALALALANCAGMPDAPNPNLCPESGFERDAGWWRCWVNEKRSAIPGKAELDFSQAFEGKASFRIDTPSPDGATSLFTVRPIPVTPGQTYTFSIYMKGRKDEDAAKGLVLIKIFGEKDKLIGSELQSFPITDDWRRCVVTVKIPEGAKGVKFLPRMNGRGSVWYDAAKFEAGDRVTAYTPGPDREADGK